jgi:hypothetical protein
MSAKRLVLQSILDRCGRGDDGYDCFREGSAHRVRLWGDLPPAWPGGLCLHLSALGIAIVSCDAARIGAARWAATLLLRAADLRARLRGYDFLRMARRIPRFLPQLSEPAYQIALENALEDSSIVVAHVTGQDAIGLRAAILRRFETLSLRACELSLRAIDGQVDDRFWLERVSMSDSPARNPRLSMPKL